MKKELLNTTSLTPRQPVSSKALTPKELARVLGQARQNRSVGLKGGQRMVVRQ